MPRTFDKTAVLHNGLIKISQSCHRYVTFGVDREKLSRLAGMLTPSFTQPVLSLEFALNVNSSTYTSSDVHKEHCMRNVFITVVGILALLTVSAVGGDYHYKTTLNCNECHVMHASQGHGYNNDGGGIFVTPNGPHDALLRDEPTALCLNCHDGQTFAPDVLAANGGNVPTNGREAGALNRDNTAPYFDAAGHTLYSTATAPGGTFSATDGLGCVNCHTVHGSANYRNARVRGVSTAIITYAVGSNDPTKDVFERSASSGGDHYSTTNVDFNEPNVTASGYGNFCKGCHTQFHGASADVNMYNMADSAWQRHPTAEANISVGTTARFNNRPYRVKVMSASGDWGTQGVAWTAAPADLTPSCMSCHKAHGNQNAFGLIFATGNAVIDENGDGTSVKVLCQQCHRQGI
jgi:hypothetical protein